MINTSEYHGTDGSNENCYVWHVGDTRNNNVLKHFAFLYKILHIIWGFFFNLKAKRGYLGYMWVASLHTGYDNVLFVNVVYMMRQN